jgi:hypothetical protein
LTAPDPGATLVDVLLIDDRPPPPVPPDRPVWEPDLRLCALVLIALGSIVGCFMVEGVATLVLVCAALWSATAAMLRALPYGNGMREHRQ